ncbi:CHRD domain-containing protein [Pontibacter populi]|uniref:CHRD domain-containing protein n=1 Tax=Pontibacter populi TaxID=890055 RepID=A0ABV1RYC4_9BACT
MKINVLPDLRILAICASLFAFTTACDEDEDPPGVNKSLEFTNIELSAANQVPAFSDEELEFSGFGTFNGTYNDATNILTYTIVWNLVRFNDAATGMHFHGPADPTENAAIVMPIEGFDNTTIGTFSDATDPLTAQQEADLKAGLWYINIHSTTYPDGVLRGNLIVE